MHTYIRSKFSTGATNTCLKAADIQHPRKANMKHISGNHPRQFPNAKNVNKTFNGSILRFQCRS